MEAFTLNEKWYRLELLSCRTPFFVYRPLFLKYSETAASELTRGRPLAVSFETTVRRIKWEVVWQSLQCWLWVAEAGQEPIRPRVAAVAAAPKVTAQARLASAAWRKPATVSRSPLSDRIFRMATTPALVPTSYPVRMHQTARPAALTSVSSKKPRNARPPLQHSMFALANPHAAPRAPVMARAAETKTVVPAPLVSAAWHKTAPASQSSRTGRTIKAAITPAEFALTWFPVRTPGKARQQAQVLVLSKTARLARPPMQRSIFALAKPHAAPRVPPAITRADR